MGDIVEYHFACSMLLEGTPNNWQAECLGVQASLKYRVDTVIFKFRKYLSANYEKFVKEMLQMK